MHKRIVAVVGRSKVGKTSLIEYLVGRLSEKGLKVSVIKHAFHPLKMGEGDAERVFKAGAQVSCVTSDQGSSVIFLREGGYGLLEKLLSLSQDADLVILEGFKKLDFPKILVLGNGDPPEDLENVVATFGERSYRGSKLLRTYEEVFNFLVDFFDLPCA